MMFSATFKCILICREAPNFIRLMRCDAMIIGYRHKLADRHISWNSTHIAVTHKSVRRTTQIFHKSRHFHVALISRCWRKDFRLNVKFGKESSSSRFPTEFIRSLSAHNFELQNHIKVFRIHMNGNDWLQFWHSEGNYMEISVVWLWHQCHSNMFRRRLLDGMLYFCAERFVS